LWVVLRVIDALLYYDLSSRLPYQGNYSEICRSVERG
jgi:hypothetical protein